MRDPWGLDDPPARPLDPLPPLPPRLARLAEVAASGVALEREDPYAEGFPAAGELPEVQALMVEGWRPLHGAPLYQLLPAAWPRELRTWVPDRLPLVSMGGTSDEYFGSIHPLHDESDERAAEEGGRPRPPTGRIWLLRSPWPRIPVAAIYSILWGTLPGGHGHDEEQQLYAAARDVLTWSEDRALDACPPATRQLLDAWAAAGRVGEDASSVVEHHLQPADLDRLMTGAGLDEPTALAWLESLATHVDDDTIAFISAWRAAGLPGDPPPGAARYRDRDPAELRAWLDAGFDLYAAGRLELAGLDTAVRWRTAGFTEADTYRLLRSDPALTPEEAHAFDDAGIERDKRAEWTYLGFTATKAAAWTAVDIGPEAARLWRACDKGPTDAEPGHEIPPQLTAGARSQSQWDELADPPGTRGRRARRWAGDDHPWINTD